MKTKNLKSIAFAALLAGVCALNGWADGTDFTRLTRATLPHEQVVIQEALNNLDIDPATFESWKKKARWSTLLPQLRLAVGYTPDIAANWNKIDGYSHTSVYQHTSTITNKVTQTRDIDRSYYDGTYDDRLDYGVYLRWDLQKLVFNYNEANINRSKFMEASLRRRRIVDISQRYVLLAAALPADESDPMNESNYAVILENAIMIDFLTDSFLTRTLESIDRKRLSEAVLNNP